MIGALLLLAAAAAPLPSRTAEITDPDTRAWWAATEALAGDDMEGRDTGSPGYDRSAKLVAERFAQAGLKPGGDGGSWFQPFRLTDIRVETAGTTIRAGTTPLRPLHDIALRPSSGMPRTSPSVSLPQ